MMRLTLLLCVGLVACGGKITAQATLPPPAVGGTIVDGDYVLTSAL